MVVLPASGRYVYRGRVERTPGPSDELDDIEVVVEHVRDSSDWAEIRLSENQRRVTTELVLRWGPGRVLEMSSHSNPGKLCVWDPPIEVLHFPLEAGEFPEQTWSAPECGVSGRVLIAVEGEETVLDVGGRSWRVWKIRERRVGISGAELTDQSLRWFSPDLFVDVKSEKVITMKVGGLSGTKRTEMLLAKFSS